MGSNASGVLLLYSWMSDAAKWSGLPQAERIKICLHDLSKYYADDPEIDVYEQFIEAFDIMWTAESCRGDAMFLPGQFSRFFEVAKKREGQIFFVGEHLSNHDTFATAASPCINRIHGHHVKKLGGPKPEARLPHLVFLSWLIPVGLFWFAWTCNPSVHWASCILSGIPFGIGFVTLFLGITSYLIDCYGKYAASALAANAILRSLFGAGFPLFSREMYDELGAAWATSVLGFVALAMAPLPYFFYHFGPRIRAASTFHRKTIEEEKGATSTSRSTGETKS